MAMRTLPPNGHDVTLMLVGTSWVIICIAAYLLSVASGSDPASIVPTPGNRAYVNEKKRNPGGHSPTSSIVGGVARPFEGGECDAYMHRIDSYVPRDA